MSEILKLIDSLAAEDVHVPAGTVIIRQECPCQELYVLLHGAVEVVRDGQQLSLVDEPGALFGELSMLLQALPIATVRTLQPSTFRVLKDPALFQARLQENLPASLEVVRMLARRLSLLDSRFDTLMRQECAV